MSTWTRTKRTSQLQGAICCKKNTSTFVYNVLNFILYSNTTTLIAYIMLFYKKKYEKYFLSKLLLISRLFVMNKFRENNSSRQPLFSSLYFNKKSCYIVMFNEEDDVRCGYGPFLSSSSLSFSNIFFGMINISGDIIS